MSVSEQTDSSEQYVALRSGRAIVELPNWTCVAIAGADRQKFLHNFCTNDIKALRPGGGCEVFVLNAKGKVVAHGLVACRDNELMFLGTPGQGTRLVEHLDRYIIREDVQLSDQSSAVKCFFAPECDALKRLVGVVVPWQIIGSGAESFVVVRAGDGVSVDAASAECGLISVPPSVFDAARIEAGFPIYGVDFDDNNLPQELGRDTQAISFNKGCYLGQETVARIDALGHVNQKLVGVRLAGETLPALGTHLFNNGAPVGEVTSIAWSPKLKAPLALAMVRRGANTAGSQLESSAGPAEVVELPAH